MCTAPPTKKINAPVPSDPTQEAVEQQHAKQQRELADNLEEHVIQVHKQVVWLKWAGIIFATLGSMALAVAIAYKLYWLGVIGAVMTILSAGLVAFFLERSGEERRYYDQWKRAELACDLLLFHATPDGCKADKLLSNNDEQLRSYYELNLAQCSKIFWVGILCVAAGIGVVAVTLSYIIGSKNDPHAQTVIGAVGGASAILVNFVAAVFLKMHSELLTIQKEFQSKLVDTQELYLANVLASRISDDNKRSDAFKDLSYVMAAVMHPCAEVAYQSAKPTGTNGASSKVG